MGPPLNETLGWSQIFPLIFFTARRTRAFMHLMPRARGTADLRVGSKIYSYSLSTKIVWRRLSDLTESSDDKEGPSSAGTAKWVTMGYVRA